MLTFISGSSKQRRHSSKSRQRTVSRSGRGRSASSLCTIALLAKTTGGYLHRGDREEVVVEEPGVDLLLHFQRVSSRPAKATIAFALCCISVFVTRTGADGTPRSFSMQNLTIHHLSFVIGKGSVTLRMRVVLNAFGRLPCFSPIGFTLFILQGTYYYLETR